MEKLFTHLITDFSKSIQLNVDEQAEDRAFE